MKSNRTALIWVLATITLLAGCGTPRQGPGELARKWSCKLREMQIRPVFPPREDVHVGDVYWLPDASSETTPTKRLQGDAAAYCNWEGQRDFMEIGTHLAYVEGVGKELNKHYGQRPSLPASGTSSVSVSVRASDGFVIEASPRSTAPVESTELFTTGANNRTRQVAFPDYMAVEVDQASFGAVGTASGLPFGLGASRSGESSVRVSIPVAESYGLPLLPLVSAVKASLSTTATTSLCAGTQTAAVLEGSFLDDKRGAVHVVQEVFYARAIDVEMSDRRAAGMVGGWNAGSTTLSVPGSGSVTSSTADGTSSQAMIEAVVKAAWGQLDQRAGLPGVTLSLSSAQAGRIVLRRVLDRPVAIGMRSVELKLAPNKGSNCLVAVGPPENTADPMTGKIKTERGPK